MHPVSQPDTEPAPSVRRRPTRRILLIAAAVAVLLAAGGAFVYLSFGDRGQFDAEPPACATLTPSLHLLGVAYTAKQDESNSCQLTLPPHHPAYVAAPKITVAYGVSDSPDEAGKALQPLEAESRPLPGVGDEAYLRDRDVFLRVSNLVVGIVVFPQQASTEEQVVAFATDLARRLRKG